MPEPRPEPVRPKRSLWTPTKRQATALSIDCHEILFGGARGGAKTDGGIVWIILPVCGPDAIIEIRGRFRGLVIRKNYTDLCDWIDRAKTFYSPYGWKLVDEEFRHRSGAVIRTGHLKDAEAYQKYQGHEYHRLLIEELTQIPDEESYLRLTASIRSSIPGIRPGIFLTTNPGGPGHFWVKKRFIDVAPPDVPYQDPISKEYRVYLPALLKDNPYIGDSYRRQLEALPDHLRRAWLDGDWDALAGQYFDDFDQAIHVVQPFEIPDHWERYVGLDWGFSPNPWAAVFCAVDEEGDVVVWREMTGNKMTPQEVARTVMGGSPRRISEVIADPSMWTRKDGESSAEKMVAENVPLRAGNNDRLQGWLRIHEYLRVGERGYPHLRIFSTCRELIRCLPAMIHDSKKPEDASKDGNIDHLPDALRYFLMSRPLPAEPERRRVVFQDDRSRRAYEHRKKFRKK